MSFPGVPEVVRNKAIASGAAEWVDELPEIVSGLERDWEMRIGRPFTGGTEAFVAEAKLEDGTNAVLKVMIPRDDRFVRNEITALRIANGEGCAELLREDASRNALLTERLGPSLFDLSRPLSEQHEILCATAKRLWRPAPDCGLPTGAWKGRWLTDFITRSWDELDRPCSERAVEYALECAARRVALHDDERAVLVHGDLQQWNALQSGDGFKMVDPDGLLAEAEYDLGILMREDPVDLMKGDPRGRAAKLARRTGLDATAVWDWGVVERVSTGLVCTRIGLQPVGRQMLEAADQVSEL